MDSPGFANRLVQVMGEPLSVAVAGRVESIGIHLGGQRRHLVEAATFLAPRVFEDRPKHAVR
jgi:hypothetical protein